MADPIVRGAALQAVKARKDYRVNQFADKLKHFVEFTTTPENPFVAHSHPGSEFWYIIEGSAIIALDGIESSVEAGDFIYLEPNHSHGLRTESRARWICMG
jgi:mannose-6-phosphate isomerase-like protein (cupin superfamily)